MSYVDDEDFEVIPSAPIPGQVGKVFTILALTENESFTDPEHAPLLTRIKYSAEHSAASLSAKTPASSDNVKTRRSNWKKRCNWKNVVVCLCLWLAYTLCNVAYSMINPFFPQIVSQ